MMKVIPIVLKPSMAPFLCAEKCKRIMIVISICMHNRVMVIIIVIIMNIYIFTNCRQFQRNGLGLEPADILALVGSARPRVRHPGNQNYSLFVRQLKFQ